MLLLIFSAGLSASSLTSVLCSNPALNPPFKNLISINVDLTLVFPLIKKTISVLL